MTLDPAVTYDRDKPAAAVGTLAAKIDQVPLSVCVAGRERDVRRLRGEGLVGPWTQDSLLAALDQQLLAPEAPASITVDAYGRCVDT